MPAAPQEVGQKFCVEYNPDVTGEGSSTRAAFVALAESYASVKSVQIIGSGNQGGQNNPNQFRDPLSGALLLSMFRVIPAMGYTKAQAAADVTLAVAAFAGIVLCGEEFCPAPALFSDVTSIVYSADKHLGMDLGYNQDSGIYNSSSGTLDASMVHVIRTWLWDTSQVIGSFSVGAPLIAQVERITYDAHGDLTPSSTGPSSGPVLLGPFTQGALSIRIDAGVKPVRTPGGALPTTPQFKIAAGEKFTINAPGGISHDVVFQEDFEVFNAIDDTKAARDTAVTKRLLLEFFVLEDETAMLRAVDPGSNGFNPVGAVNHMQVKSGSLVVFESRYDATNTLTNLVDYARIQSPDGPWDYPQACTLHPTTQTPIIL